MSTHVRSSMYSYLGNKYMYTLLNSETKYLLVHQIGVSVVLPMSDDSISHYPYRAVGKIKT